MGCGSTPAWRSPRAADRSGWRPPSSGPARAFQGGTNAANRTVNPTTVPIEDNESYRWLENLTDATHRLGDPGRCPHAGAREADIVEPFHAARTHVLVRTAVDRLAGRGRPTVAKVVKRQPVRGEHTVAVRDAHRHPGTATVRVRFCRVTVHPSPARRKRYGPLSWTAIWAVERGRPPDREPIRWKRLTDLPVDDLAAAIETLDWYAMRWTSAVFHKVLKSGGRAEPAKLRTTARVSNLLALLCVVGWRVFWRTMAARAAPDAAPEVGFTPAEIAVLYRVAGDPPEAADRTVAHDLVEVAKLGGYLARAQDPPPGNVVVWRGLARLAGSVLGFEFETPAEPSCG